MDPAIAALEVSATFVSGVWEIARNVAENHPTVAMVGTATGPTTMAPLARRGHTDPNTAAMGRNDPASAAACCADTSMCWPWPERTRS